MPRKNSVLWKLSATIAPAAEEAVVALLERVTGQPVSVEVDWETRRTRASAFLERRGDWSAGRQRALAEGLRRLEGCGLEPGPVRVTVRKIPRENWAESWKRHFKAIEIGGALLIKPSWIRRRPKAGQAVVVLDPGLSFGTGHHATTRYCLRQLARYRAAGGRQGMLDVGCGSGLLAIAAVKLGYDPVAGFDFDPEAVRVARENARRNGARVPFRRRDLTTLRGRAARRYAVVCANLTADLLVSQRRRLVSWVAPSGVLVLAGILGTQFPAVRAAYERAGWRLADQVGEGEWCSGTFRREQARRGGRGPS